MLNAFGSVLTRVLPGQLALGVMHGTETGFHADELWHH